MEYVVNGASPSRPGAVRSLHTAISQTRARLAVRRREPISTVYVAFGLCANLYRRRTTHAESTVALLDTQYIYTKSNEGIVEVYVYDGG